MNYLNVTPRAGLAPCKLAVTGDNPPILSTASPPQVEGGVENDKTGERMRRSHCPPPPRDIKVDSVLQAVT